METSFVEFEFADNKRFDMLVAVFDALRAAKKSDSFPSDQYWFAFFDEEALAHFWWPTEQEILEWEQHWKATPVRQRFTDLGLQRPWLFGAMLDAIRDGEYELVTCAQLSDSRGRLEFVPYGWPYGGAGCMKALIEAFGLKAIGALMYVIVWRFDMIPEHVAEFEKQYGPSGVWAQLFSKSTGYLGTQLFRDTDRPHQYVTFDYWESEAAFQEFKDKFGAEYKAIDSTFERLTLAETRLGTFSSTIDHT